MITSGEKDVSAGWEKTEDWFWEGNIQSAIVDFMEKDEFEIISQTDTQSKQRGPDIVSKKNGKQRLVFVKGYPSTKYADGAKKGQKKRTRPDTQARHWFAQAIRDAILAKGDDSSLEIALGFPNIRTYRLLIRRSSWALEKLGFYCYLVDEDSRVFLLTGGVSD